MRCVSLAVATAALLLSSVASARGSGGGHSSHSSSSHSTHVPVKSYKTHRGTQVDPHERTAPNNTKRDNWSTQGNVNPHTGKAGTKSP